MKILFLLLISWPVIAADSIALQLEAGLSESLRFPSIEQVTVSEGRVLRARQMDANTLLLTARKPGQSYVRVWDSGGKEHAYRVTVTAPGRLALGGSADLGVVHVSLQILDVSSQARDELGVHWPQMFQFEMTAVGGAQPGLGVRFDSAQGWLRQLLDRGWAKMLSQPELSVVMGEQATFSSGGEVPFPVLTDSYGRLQQSIQWKQYGLLFKIRPESSDGFVVRSDIQIEISELAASSGVQNIPAVYRRNLNTKIHSKDGETVFLSGLLRTGETRGNTQVPFLAEIPVLGIFFQSHSNASENSEVLIAMTLGLKTHSTNERKNQRLNHLIQEPPRD
jgi:Flp pilus assembly secretin CpaC